MGTNKFDSTTAHSFSNWKRKLPLKIKLLLSSHVLSLWEQSTQIF